MLFRTYGIPLDRLSHSHEGVIGANQCPLSLAFEHLTYPNALNLIIGSPLVRRASSPLPLSLTPALLLEAREGVGSVRKYLMEIVISI